MKKAKQTIKERIISFLSEDEVNRQYLVEQIERLLPREYSN